MSQVGKIMVLVGIATVIVGLLIWGIAKAGFRGLPGDVRYESQNVKFYFPIVTCLVVSALLTAVLTLAAWVWRWWHR